MERDFFNALDHELSKVDQFFVAREREALLKSSALREQMRELKNHHKVYHVGTLFMRLDRPMNAHLQQYTNAPGRFATLATISGVVKFAPLAKFFHQRGGGQVQEGTNRRPTPPMSPNTFSINADGTGTSPGPAIVQLDPEEYHYAKKKLRKAVLEFYK